MRTTTLLITALVLAAAGCGGDDDNDDSGNGAADEPHAAEAVELPSSPEGPAALEPGTPYFTPNFRPKVTFTLPEGSWRTSQPEDETDFGIELQARAPTEQAILSFVHVDKVYDPEKELDDIDDTEPAPDDLVGWLAEHPKLEAGDPVPVELDGLKGRQIDVEVVEKPGSSRHCNGGEGGECVGLFNVNGEPITFNPGNKLRYMVFDTGEEPPLTIETFVNPGSEFEAVLPELEAALKEVEIES